ncbi:hypothetical protein SAMN05445871_5450 [Paraburkholderia caballeronis]|uniref:Uncharacterized protein n=1 Tax=Paraburkholderia caballeronis TaxID=416943 RepID=A0A1H7RNP2_9BURK|nr:hypothetical protein C7403_11176 [Paraburkholderia caballeronis]PXW97758.1 hypothetical protein C7407_11176 [Paraburkholderia caballeronis]RAJ94728.1 hypothetical protein C7409_11176 [Paraburkholderia caballeronis]SEE60357.1 hypothetical protein SAMN05445871_5450 [Paraburkholderia caballeronis]SEL61007.1 hypothetical protein SAMN05192542_11076 [Paraburkholderia caballeronis]
MPNAWESFSIIVRFRINIVLPGISANQHGNAAKRRRPGAVAQGPLHERRRVRYAFLSRRPRPGKRPSRRGSILLAGTIVRGLATTASLWPVEGIGLPSEAERTPRRKRRTSTNAGRRIERRRRKRSAATNCGQLFIYRGIRRNSGPHRLIRLSRSGISTNSTAGEAASRCSTQARTREVGDPIRPDAGRRHNRLRPAHIRGAPLKTGTSPR